jgi:hypothetical protein
MQLAVDERRNVAVPAALLILHDVASRW